MFLLWGYIPGSPGPVGSALHANRPRRPSGQPRKWGRKGRGERGDELCWPTLSSCLPRTPATGNRFQAHDAGKPEGLYVEAPPTRARARTRPASLKRQSPAALLAGLQPPLAQGASGARAVHSLEDGKVPPKPRRQSRIPQSHGKARKGQARKAEGTHLAKAAQERRTRSAALLAQGPAGPNCAPRSSPALRRRPPLLPPRGRLLQFLGAGNRRYYREGGQSRSCGDGPAQGWGGISSEGSRCQKGRGEEGLGKSEGKPVRCPLLRSQNQFVPPIGSLPAGGQMVNAVEQ